MGLKVLKKFQSLDTHKLYKPGETYNPPDKAEQKKLVDAGYLQSPPPTKAEQAAELKARREVVAKKAEAEKAEAEKAEAEKAEADKKAAEEKAAKTDADKAKTK